MTLHRSTLLSLVFVAAAVTVSARQAPGDFQSLSVAYQSGDRDVLTRTIRTVNDLRRLVPFSYNRNIEYPINLSEPWSRTKALFYVELAALAIEHKWSPELSTLTDAAASYLVRRPDAPGKDPGTDAFETGCHAIILASYQGAIAPDFMVRYVTNWIAGRKHRPDDPRFTLAKAIASEQLFLPSTLVRIGASSESSLLIGTSRTARQLATDAMLAFMNARRDPTIGAEASIRLGFILYRDAKPADALQYLNAVDTVKDDPVLQYWGRLFRGRAFDVLGRVDEARQQYADANAVVPGAQSARVALIALNFRSSQRDEALVSAKAMLGAPASTEDPWLLYWLGQHRFMNKWIADARGQLK
jgi:hypothetical protein